VTLVVDQIEWCTGCFKMSVNEEPRESPGPWVINRVMTSERAIPALAPLISRFPHGHLIFDVRGHLRSHCSWRGSPDVSQYALAEGTVIITVRDHEIQSKGAPSLETLACLTVLKELIKVKRS
jgi:hypothetical protein